MRKVFAVLAIFLGACGSDGNGIETPLEPHQHVPRISNLTLSPDSALYMEGNGSVEVTAEVSYADFGQDIETLQVRISGGQVQTIPVAELVDGFSGTLTTQFVVTTVDQHERTVDIWLVDRAGQSSNHLIVAFPMIEHAPEITSVTLAPESAQYMDGDGDVAVTAEIEFRDAGSDIEALWVEMPDGKTFEFAMDVAAETGSFTEEFTVSTQRVGEQSIRFWLVDAVLAESAPLAASFTVLFDSPGNDWTNRLTTPREIYDVAWDGQVFVAVGQGGAIWTSANGINWEASISGVSSDLYAVAAYDGDIFAVGGGVILMSTDHGKTWISKAGPDFIGATTAVAVNATQVIAAVATIDFRVIILRSNDRGDTWQSSDFVTLVTDLIYQNDMFVAVSFDRVLVSADGVQWNQTLFHEWNESGWFWVAMYDGEQFFVSGDRGTVYSSADGFNWTSIQTPTADADYRSAASDGSRVLLAGGSPFQDWEQGIYQPIGLGSADGGATWEVFAIDGSYQSNGMAWGNGRFVSVGWTPETRRGAIYTTE